MTPTPAVISDERKRIEQSIRHRAQARVRKKLGFYWHAAVFILANAAMLAINLQHSPEYLWFIWPLCGWGTALALHGFATFQGTGMSEAMVEAEIQRELAKRGMA